MFWLLFVTVKVAAALTQWGLGEWWWFCSPSSSCLSPPFAGFHSTKAAPYFAENHLFLLYFLRNKNLPRLTAEHLGGKHTKQQNWRKCSATPVFWRDRQEDQRNDRQDSLTSAPGEMGGITLGKIPRHEEDKEDTGSSHGFTKGKWCWPAWEYSGLKDGLAGKRSSGYCLP